MELEIPVFLYGGKNRNPTMTAAKLIFYSSFFKAILYQHVTVRNFASGTTLPAL
jgi:hypothetical protein